MRVLPLVLAFTLTAAAWQKPAKQKPATPPPASETPDPEDAEEKELEQQLAEAGSASVEYARVLELHLKKYPKTARRAEIQRILARAAVDMRDKNRLIEYGVPVIEAGSQDSQILEHTTRALLDRPGQDNLERALRYAKRLEALVDSEIASLRKPGEFRPGAGKRLDDLQLLRGRALTFQARAAGGLDRKDEASSLAQRAWESYPSAEAAREVARWLERAGNNDEALAWLAQAAVSFDPRATAEQRRAGRQKLGELYARTKGSEAGLGDVILAAYDRNAAVSAARLASLRAFDPNYSVSQALDFTLTGIGGNRLALSTLRGKVTVMDFWATWCGPCRAQYPLYEQVKQRFKDRADVVFLAVNTDEDRTVVEPFLQAQKWNKTVYFDDGLSGLFRVNSIPTTIVLDRNGVIVSRLNGYIADRFVDMLSARIDGALSAGQ
ncbi:MAG: TlpA family protein disulfide reductase [Bryobacterales bacterium]|nr:TlpA family protein disulfide reductase [Bryobacterales bacterium]